jgi:beta-glucanase (GH16 family)
VAEARGLRRRPVQVGLALVAGLVLYLVLAAALAPKPCEPSGEALWIDDFDGPAGSAPNPTHWVAAEGGGGWGNEELQHYRAGNAQLDGDSHLVIAALIDPLAPDSERYTSARLSSVESFTTGRLSARIILPDGPGLLPAFWAMGTDLEQVGWPAAGEIDIVETPAGTAHSVHSIHAPSLLGERSAKINVDVTHDEPLSAGFHTYWVERTEGLIVIGIDDETVATFDRDRVDRDMEWVFDKPFSALFSLAIGGVWPGSPDETTPARSEMIIDWVRLDPACGPSS